MTPQEARKLWTDALRSGEYKQGRGVLCDPSTQTFCCLGVACEVYQKHVGDLMETEFLSTAIAPLGHRDYDDCMGMLPERVAKWLDITATGLFDNGKTLTQLNDRLKATFDEIADFIDGGTLESHDSYIPVAA